MAEESNTSELLEKLSSNSNSNTKMRLLEARMMGHPSPVETSASKGSPAVKDLSTVWDDQKSPARVDEASTNSDSEEDAAGQFSIHEVNPVKRKSFADVEEMPNEVSHKYKLRLSEPQAQAKSGAKRGRSAASNGTRKAPKVSGTSSPLLRSAAASGPEKGGNKRGGTINNYFLPVEDGIGELPQLRRRQSIEQEVQTEVRFLEIETKLKERCSRLEGELTAASASSRSLADELARVKEGAEEAERANERLQNELRELKEREANREKKRLKLVSDLLIDAARGERLEARQRLREDSVRLGDVKWIRAGTVITEVWQDGQVFKDLNARQLAVVEQRAQIEARRKQLKKKGTDKGSPDADGASTSASEDEVLATEEIYKLRLVALKKDEDAILRDQERFKAEKSSHIREMKRIRDEDASRFNHFQILNKRYALLNLLGKGGFSEVYKAFDLVEYRHVACKLHQLNPTWSEEKKQSYVRHAIREYEIHKKLDHPRIVRLLGIFEIDNNTFCTVLEYCDGKDLDSVLKATPFLPEREARCLGVQIFAGLAYLNQPQHRVIHYDLKPGNILFDAMGEVKITDFGLSKIMEDEGASQGMELTSQGAGTYWYLPPECFERGRVPPLISSKVDVWAAGVILYQMLYGKRPFGDDQSQEAMLRNDTILRAPPVEFPAKPAVSNEAKDFIRRCLTFKQQDRPDVLTAVQDPYLSYTRRKG